MSHIHRFYIPTLSQSAKDVLLTDEEAHHALRVVRVQTGDRVCLFDGQGREADAVVSSASKREVSMEVRALRVLEPPRHRLVLLQAWLHREKGIEFVIEHGTEVGVSKFVFFRARRSERVPKVHPRWEKLAIEACKQCGRLWLPEFECANNLEDALRLAEGTVLLATKDIDPSHLSQRLGDGDATIVIGPEGDFSEEELHQVTEHGGSAISLGKATYRSEMAALLAAALVKYEWERQEQALLQIDHG